MMYETLQRIKDLLIGRNIYINQQQGHAKNRNYSVTRVSPKVLHKLPNYSYIRLFLPASTKLIINETQHALRLLTFRLRYSKTCFVYFGICNNVLKKSGPCNVGPGQRNF